ncbi:unnamed protein product [Symbiodinium natans]|uniref:Biotin protein ligase C-terminal domain-containing protein n=1 Tax=Symbiodinium natans TaxID=878477 RepID=A0A812SYC8_9DINO|nr:unnamed protein product [Symbiodinium natans]
MVQGFRHKLSDVIYLPRFFKVPVPPHAVLVDGTASAEIAATNTTEAAAIEQAAPPSTFAVHDFAMFSVGENVTYPGDERGQVVGIDEDGDLQVVTDSGRKTTWYGSKCSKALSKSNRVRYTSGEVAELKDFDSKGDLLVQTQDGKVARWSRENSERILSVGDRVQHTGGEAARVVGFSRNGDVIVLKQDNGRATWLAGECT